MINLYRLSYNKAFVTTTYWLILSEDVMIYTQTNTKWFYAIVVPSHYIDKIDKSVQTLRELL